MTPFGEALRRLRAERGVTQKAMADAIGVTPAYLSALERGHRGRPSWQFVQRVIGFFNIIWDEADELERLALLSAPRVIVDTSGLESEATGLANRLAQTIRDLDDKGVLTVRDCLEREVGRVLRLRGDHGR